MRLFSLYDCSEVVWNMALDNDDANKFKIASGGSWNNLAGGTRLTIQTNGNVGIGTTGPTQKLHVHTESGADNNIVSVVNDEAFDPLFSLYDCSEVVWNMALDNDDANKFKIASGGSWNNLAGGTRLTIQTNGNVGIGTTSPNYKLHVEGTAYATGAAGSLSDYRHKTNISDLSFDALDVVNELHPVTFEWKEPQDIGMEGLQLGFIAQEIEEVIPEAVLTQNNDEQTKGLKYNALIPILTKATQELVAENDSLKAEIKALKTENETIRQEIEKIKAIIGL